MSHTVIIGAGTAGINIAANLRQHGHTGKITLLGAESAAPYHRPPLSKTFLAPEKLATPTPLKPPAFYEKNQIDLQTGVKVRAINRQAKTVATQNGQTIEYDRLVLATGSSARRLRCAGSNLAGLHYLRNLDDAEQLRDALDNAQSVAILGAGVIGLEIASAAISHGKKVTVIEAAGRVMARVTTPIGSNIVTKELQAAGVDFKLNAKLASFHGEQGKVTACLFEDGTSSLADMVVIGIGGLANQGLAIVANLACDNGILVDENMRTSDASIYAIGDCASAENAFLGGRFRIETIHNAMTQAQIAACHICGIAAPDLAAPRFWSDLKGMKVQGLGALTRYDKLVIKQNTANCQVEVHAMRQNQVVATETINLPKRQAALAGLLVKD